MDHASPALPPSPTTTKSKAGHVNVTMAAATDVGKVRTVNEDFYYFSQSHHLAMVCDGMGGLQAGAAASRMAGKTIRDALNLSDRALLARLCEDVKDKLHPTLLKIAAGVRLANRRVFLATSEDRNLKGMGTTVAVLAISENHACLAHVGDSRIYLLRDSMLMQITQDHSWLNELLEDQEIARNEVESFRKKNVLTRALGTHPAIKIDVQMLPLQPQDAFLLCSDGLHNALSAEMILTTLLEHHEQPQAAADALMQRAKSADGSDNITAVFVKVDGKGPTDNNAKPFSIVLPEEDSRLFVLEDRYLRERYPVQPHSGDSISSRRKIYWVGATTAFALAILLIFYSIWQQASTPRKANNPGVATTRAPTTAGGEVSKSPGQLVLVEVSGAAQLQQLSAISGVRVVQTFPAARNGTAPPPGRYTLMLADSISQTGNRRNRINTGTTAQAPVRQPERATNSDSTTKGPRYSGQIFLTGANEVANTDAAVFANDLPVAPLRQVLFTGFLLKPGTYDLAIKDSAGRVLLHHNKLEVRRGEVKFVELIRGPAAVTQ